jgi:hypothetical protein
MTSNFILAIYADAAIAAGGRRKADSPYLPPSGR